MVYNPVMTMLEVLQVEEEGTMWLSIAMMWDFGVEDQSKGRTVVVGSKTWSEDTRMIQLDLNHRKMVLVGKGTSL